MLALLLQNKFDGKEKVNIYIANNTEYAYLPQILLGGKVTEVVPCSVDFCIDEQIAHHFCVVVHLWTHHSKSHCIQVNISNSDNHVSVLNPEQLL